MRAGLGADSITAGSLALSGAQSRCSMEGVICGSPQEVAMDRLPLTWLYPCPFCFLSHLSPQHKEALHSTDSSGRCCFSWLQSLTPQAAPSAHLSSVRTLSLALVASISQGTAAQGPLLTQPTHPLPGATQTLMTPTPGLGSPSSAPELQALGPSDFPGHSTMADQPPGVFQGQVYVNPPSQSK